MGIETFTRTYYWDAKIIIANSRKNLLSQISILISNDPPLSNINFEEKLSEMKRSARIVDQYLHWREPSPALDYLLDNSDFLVVGVIGQQGVGKSSLMSLLGGSTWRDKVKIFMPYLIYLDDFYF